VRVALERAAGRTPTPLEPAAPEPRGSVPPAAPLPPVVVPVAEPAPVAAAPLPGEGEHRAQWQLPSDPASVTVVRRRLRALLHVAGVDDDQAYDLLLAACEAASNAIEHAQDPTEPVIEVAASVGDDLVEITVRDHGQWRERVPSMDRGRGSTLMSAFADVTATPSPEGTLVRISSPRLRRRAGS
ncbi:ATP-binding protein, partial [Blastococcus atacamensis]|uniref:ATP-binding protein n=1 Tax=Blastococcus atacamensis TaxID=2070508 RepID=UPI0018E4D16F